MATTQQSTEAAAAKILCCLCGTSIAPNPANMCLNCIRAQVDISEGIPKQEVVQFCKGCERYLQPPKYWVKCDLESRELLHICLKRLKGLNKIKLVDANFVWTEPHSRRLKIKLTIQKEVFNGTVVQQSFVVEFIVSSLQCEACQRSYTEHTWKAIVQVRQHVDHKRTMFWLEQLILKHNMHENCNNVKERPDGIDFYFGHKSHAQKLVHFLGTFCPIKTKTSERLITHDAKSNIFNYKYSFSIDIAPICREDLICLTPKQSKHMFGGIGPVLMCYKINSALHFMDPTTLKTTELAAPYYWKAPFKALLNSRQLVEYTVLDVELVQGVKTHKWQLAEVQICKEEDMGNDNGIVFTKTHLGHLLHPGDSVLGYDMKNSNYNDKNMDYGVDFPDVILVRKVYHKQNKKRTWKLKSLPKKELEEKTKADRQRKEADRERFMEEIEENEDLRATVNIYKDDSQTTKKPAKKDNNEQGKDAAEDNNDDHNDEDDDDDAPQIKEEEMLDEKNAPQVKLLSTDKPQDYDDEDMFEDDNEDADKK